MIVLLPCFDFWQPSLGLKQFVNTPSYNVQVISCQVQGNPGENR